MRTEIRDECEFLSTWGLIFRQAAKDNPHRIYLRKLYEVCIDAHLAFEGKPTHYNSDIEAGLKRFEKYIEQLAVEGAFNPIVAKRRIDFIASIAELLKEPKPVSEKQLNLF